MTIQRLKDKWPLYVAMLVVSVLLLFCMSCPPTTKSLLVNGKKVTRPELQLELDTIIATAQVRKADLDQQQAIRDIILKNALIMVEAGAFNPLGMATALFAFYGIGNAANQARNAVKKKAKKPVDNST